MPRRARKTRIYSAIGARPYLACKTEISRETENNPNSAVNNMTCVMCDVKAVHERIRTILKLERMSSRSFSQLMSGYPSDLAEHGKFCSHLFLKFTNMGGEG